MNAEPAQVPALEVSLPASSSGPRVVLAVFDGADAASPPAGPSVFCLVHADVRPEADAIARTLVDHVAPTLAAEGHDELATLLRKLTAQPNAILATGGPVPPWLGDEGETVAFVQIYRGAR